MLTIPELIKKKRDGRVLSDEEIKSFIQMVTNKSIQEAQIGAEGLRKLVFFCTRTRTKPSSVVRSHAHGHLAEGND